MQGFPIRDEQRQGKGWRNLGLGGRAKLRIPDQQQREIVVGGSEVQGALELLQLSAGYSGTELGLGGQPQLQVLSEMSLPSRLGTASHRPAARDPGWHGNFGQRSLLQIPIVVQMCHVVAAWHCKTRDWKSIMPP
jgi:hypothetical protein